LRCDGWEIGRVPAVPVRGCGCFGAAETAGGGVGCDRSVTGVVPEPGPVGGAVAVSAGARS
jgi:hypothetical protein